MRIRQRRISSPIAPNISPNQYCNQFQTKLLLKSLGEWIILSFCSTKTRERVVRGHLKE
jgi:hypothetical protein